MPSRVFAVTHTPVIARKSIKEKMRLPFASLLAAAALVLLVRAACAEPVDAQPAAASHGGELGQVVVLAAGGPALGLIVTEDGYLFTVEEGVRGASDVSVKFPDGKVVPARVVGVDKPLNVALLKVASEGLQTARTSDSVGPVTGMSVSLQMPEGLATERTRGQTGVVFGRATLTLIDLVSLFTIEADWDDAVPGAVVTDEEGKLVGMISRLYPHGDRFVPRAAAVRMDTLLSLLPELKMHGRLRRGWVGMETRPLSAEAAKKLLGLTEAVGAVVQSVDPAGPAAAGGILPEDVIFTIGDGPVKDLPNHIVDAPERIDEAAWTMRAGDVLKFVLWRVKEDANMTTRDVILRERPDGVPPVPSLPLQYLPMVSLCTGMDVGRSIPYPAEAAQRRIQGVVHLELLFGENDKLADVRVVKSPDPLLSKAAVEAVADVHCPSGLRIRRPFTFRIQYQ